MNRMARIPLHLRAEASDRGVHRPALDAIDVPPDGVEQLPLGHGLVGALGEVDQEPRLVPGERGLAPGADEGAPALIEVAGFEGDPAPASPYPARTATTL